MIGDPVDHSLSPTIHNFWLEQRGLRGTYGATRCTAPQLEHFLQRRRSDPVWRGCNVTMPLKQLAAELAEELDPGAVAIGAVNCIVPCGGALRGYNTDLDGVTAALGGEDLSGKRAVVIGSGGAARAAVVALDRRGADIVVLARKGPRCEAMIGLAPGLKVAPIYAIAEAIKEAAVVINATPLGMAGAPGMPAAILDNLGAAPGALALDMVTSPLRTEFLADAEAAGLRPVDGLNMLIGQARRAFELFFGSAPPSGDVELRTRLTGSLPAD